MPQLNPKDNRLKIVITGMGAVSASGLGQNALWHDAKNGIGRINNINITPPYDGLIKKAAQVPTFQPTNYIPKNLLPFCDRFSIFALVAAKEAIDQASLDHKQLIQSRVAVLIGTGAGGAIALNNGIYQYYSNAKRPETLSILKIIPSTAPSLIGMIYGCHGPTISIGSACSSSNQAIGLGMQMIKSGIIDKAIVGGAEACINNVSMRAWEGLRVLTNDLCRPFSKGKSGMSLGEGAAVFVLETLKSAKLRGVTPLCELAGYATTSDAQHPLRPDILGASTAIQNALEQADIEANKIGYINAHGTATHANDVCEANAILNVFGSIHHAVPVSSTKPIHGHALGASGALELVITISALRDQLLPPTINFLEADPYCPINVIRNTAVKHQFDAAMSNSFAFGGINAVLVIKNINDA